MEVFLDAQLSSSAEPPAFSLTFDPEAMTIYCIGDMAAITVQGCITRGVAFWNKKQFRGLSPLLHTLNGLLYGSTLQGSQGIGASLISSDIFPLSMPNENNQLLNLSFRCSRFYIQRLEEERAKNPSSNLSLSYTFWTAMNLVPSADETHEDTIPMLATYQDRIIHIKSRQGGGWISISRSHWSDMLTAIDFPQRRYFELPTLTPQEGAEELNKAIEHLNEAYKLFAQDRYREAVQRCRQARDSLLGENKPTWAERFLSPIVLAEKAAMINEGIKALNNLGNEASHGEGIEVDRDTASYVIASLTLILDYVGRKRR
jgi:hypothetical protein